MEKSKSQKLTRDLESTIENLQTIGADAEIKISIYDLADKTSASVNGNQSGWAASTIKLPIMIAALKQIEEEKLSFQSRIVKQSRFVLEQYDRITRIPDGTLVPLPELLYTMMVLSDNTATNMIANRIGIRNINYMMRQLGMHGSMLGHLLCRDTPRYRSETNQSGSNITCTDDMVKLIMSIYDPSKKTLSPQVKEWADIIMNFTHASFLNHRPYCLARIKAKCGFISDMQDGSDMHETGIINDHLIVSIMLNKIGQESLRYSGAHNEQSWTPQPISPNQIYDHLMRTIGRHIPA